METTGLQTRSFYITGMTCINCQNRIQAGLKSTAGVEDASVNYETGTAKVSFDAASVSPGGIIAAVEGLGYRAAEIPGSFEPRRGLQTAGLLVVIIALSLLLQAFAAGRLASAFPTAREGMGYGMLFVIGLLTSVHCIGMCGGLNLSQTLKRGGDAGPDITPPAPKSLFFPSILYNGGRLISYTVLGALVGALGSLVTVTGRFQGAVQLAAGVFMLIMGINMLGLFPQLRRFIPRMPKVFAQKIDGQKTGKGPLVVGFLNGFMPCGPLQAMQLYALASGGALRGGVSMFLFCLGTIPLMFALGTLSSILSGSKGQVLSRRVMRAGAVLVAAMGLGMFANGWGLTGLWNPVGEAAAYFRPASFNAGVAAFMPELGDGVQIVRSSLLPNRYPAITVRQGIPVRWVFDAPAGSINGCNNRFIVREYGIEHTFSEGENIIEFVPEKAGTFSYSCWMGMIRSTITVVAEGETVVELDPETGPVPAGVDIPTEQIALARFVENFQVAEIRLTNDGFEPSIVVMERWLPAYWNIHIESLDPGNECIIFPAYFTAIETEPGNNTIELIPDADFEFSTVDYAFYGYVKVVDDITSVDMDAIREEVAGYETLIYPASHFDPLMGGGGCSCCQ